MDAGIDTVKLSFALGSGALWTDNVYPMRTSDGKRGYANGAFWSGEYAGGVKGPVRYRHWTHPELRSGLTIKGVPGSSVVALWEGSVPKELGVSGVASPDLVGLLERHIRSLITRETGMRMVPLGSVRRCDITCDEYDPDGLLRLAAVGWKPHERARYVQSVHDDRTYEGHTVFQHNKTRGVRVYDNYHEKLMQAIKERRDPAEAEWARDTTRIEYQVRGDWLKKYGLDRVDEIGKNYRSVIEPLVVDLKSRAAL